MVRLTMTCSRTDEGGMVLKKALFTLSEGAEIAALLRAEHVSIPTIAIILNVSRLDLARMRTAQKGPPFVRLKRGVIVYPREAFQRYLQLSHRAEIKARTGTIRRKVSSGQIKPRDGGYESCTIQYQRK